MHDLIKQYIMSPQLYFILLGYCNHHCTLAPRTSPHPHSSPLPLFSSPTHILLGALSVAFLSSCKKRSVREKTTLSPNTPSLMLLRSPSTRRPRTSSVTSTSPTSQASLSLLLPLPLLVVLVASVLTTSKEEKTETGGSSHASCPFL